MQCVHAHPKLSHPYMTTGKTIALTRQTFVSEVMCLLLNKLSRFVKEQMHWGGLACCSPWGHKESDTTERLNWRFVVDFLPGSTHLFISGLQWPSAVISRPCQTFRCSKIPGVGKMGALLLSSYTLGLQYLDGGLQWVLCMRGPAYPLYPFKSHHHFSFIFKAPCDTQILSVLTSFPEYKYFPSPLHHHSTWWIS